MDNHSSMVHCPYCPAMEIMTPEGKHRHQQSANPGNSRLHSLPPAAELPRPFGVRPFPFDQKNDVRIIKNILVVIMINLISVLIHKNIKP